MGFSKLPLELFQQIVEEVVPRDGACHKCKRRHRDSWRYDGIWYNPDVVSLALVNTTFEAEVFKILKDCHFLAAGHAKLSPCFLDYPNIVTFLARFALTRPYEPYDEAVWHFPGVLNNTVDEIIKHEKITSNVERTRARFMTELCSVAVDQGFSSHYTPIDHYETFDDHLLVAAVYLKRAGLVDALLAHPRVMLQPWSRFFGFPLYAAVYTQNVDLLRWLMQHGAEWDFCGFMKCAPLDGVVRATNEAVALEIVNVLWEQKREELHNIWKHGDALYLAIYLDRLQLAKVLLEAHHGRATSSYYLQDHQDAMYKTLFLASEKGHRDIVRKILDIEGYMDDTQISGTKRTEIMRRACEAGSEMVLQMVLERSFELEGKQSWRPWLDCTLKATAGGHLSITRMLVNTGTIPRPFPLGGAHTLKILGEAAPRHQSAEVIRFLLRRGVINVAQLHEIQINVGFELVHCIIGAAQRGNVGVLEALSHHGIALDDEVFYARAKCPLPIIAAKAFRQVDTVRALLALGVADVDPMQSILAHQFANGELPRDPPALLNGAGLNDDNDAVARTAWVIYD